MKRNVHPRLLLAALLAVVALGAAACGDDEANDSTTTTAAPSGSEDSPETATGFPVTISTPSGDVEIAEQPERIVSLAPVATEMLFAIGAGEQVVAVDDQSDYPEGVPVTDLSGFEPNIEAIASYEPDLVVITNDLGNVVSGMEALDIPVLLDPAAATIDDTYAQIEQLGDATGHSEEAEQLTAEMAEEIDAIVSEVPVRDDPLSYYFELDDTLYTVTSNTFVGELFSLIGLVNVADEADDGSGYPQLTAEFLFQSDPEVIFLADTECCGESAETVAERPGWAELTAVGAGHVVELSDDVASRWGPRVVELLRTVADATAEF